MLSEKLSYLSLSIKHWIYRSDFDFLCSLLQLKLQTVAYGSLFAGLYPYHSVWCQLFSMTPSFLAFKKNYLQNHLHNIYYTAIFCCTLQVAHALDYNYISLCVLTLEKCFSCSGFLVVVLDYYYYHHHHYLLINYLHPIYPSQSPLTIPLSLLPLASERVPNPRHPPSLMHQDFTRLGKFSPTLARQGSPLVHMCQESWSIFGWWLCL